MAPGHCSVLEIPPYQIFPIVHFHAENTRDLSWKCFTVLLSEDGGPTYFLYICYLLFAASITFDFPADKNRFSLIVQVLHWVYWSALFVLRTYGKMSRKLRRFQKTRNWLNQIWKHIYSDSAGLVECKGYFKELSVFESQGRVKEKDQRRIKKIKIHSNAFQPFQIMFTSKWKFLCSVEL